MGSGVYMAKITNLNIGKRECARCKTKFNFSERKAVIRCFFSIRGVERKQRKAFFCFSIRPVRNSV